MPARDPVETYRELRATPELLVRVAESDAPELRLQAELRKSYADDLVRAALSLRDARLRARGKFERADDTWFDAVGLEQATPEAVARHKAARFARDEEPVVVHDYCCGVGADTTALAAAGCRVVAYDRDPLRAEFARWNVEAAGLADRVTVEVADVEALTDRDALLHVDPDRRASGSGRRRTIRLEQMVPSLDRLHQWIDEFPGGAVKLSPASNFQDKFRDVEIELVSLNGECKEATVWFGRLAGDAPWRATVLPSGETLTGDPLDAYAPPGPLGRFLHDPDPAVVRAGLVDALCEATSLSRLDAAEEYLTSDEPVDSPFTQTFEVLAEVRNNNREIRRAVRAAGFGSVEIKCRHVPVEAEAVRRRLPLDGDQPGVVVFARVEGRTRVVIARRCSQV